MNEPAPPIPTVEDDPNLANPFPSPLDPSPNDPFAIPDGADETPVQDPTPGGVPTAPVTDY